MALTATHIFAFLIGINAAFGLICYNCDSSESTLCNYAFTSFTYSTTDCKSEGALGTLTNWIPKDCVKIVAKGKDGKEYIGRGCMPAVGEGACNAAAKTLGFFSKVEGTIEEINCHNCGTDKCNSAKRYAAFTFLGVVLAAIVFLF